MKESPMPLTDRLELAAQACRAAHLLSCETTCREAATALSLAQTEIKGHMRVEEELKAEIARHSRILFEPLGDNHHNAWACPYCNPHIEEQRSKLAQAQSRIAELEKVVKFLLGEEALLGFWFGERPEGQPQFWWRKHLREALKDRA